MEPSLKQLEQFKPLEEAQKKDIQLSMIMPVWNEGMNIEIMLKILNAVVEVPHEYLIVYDFPEDNTIPVVKRLQKDFSHLQLVHNTLGKGVVNAFRAGIEASQGEYIFLMAVDDIGPVLAIEDMVALLDEGVDFVSCTRYAHGGRRLGGSWLQGILSRYGNRIFQFLSGSVLTDATTGLKMFRKSILKDITLESRPIGWAFVFE